jgi:hypothetical protein
MTIRLLTSTSGQLAVGTDQSIWSVGELIIALLYTAMGNDECSMPMQY